MENNNPKKECQVYGMLLEVKETIFLSIQYASSLEEAFLLAKFEFEKMNIGKSGAGAKISLFTLKTIKELYEDQSTLDSRIIEQKAKEIEASLKWVKAIEKFPGLSEEKPTEEPIVAPKEDSKNVLMNKIVETKDKEMFEKNKARFTKHERRYLMERLG